MTRLYRVGEPVDAGRKHLSIGLRFQSHVTLGELGMLALHPFAVRRAVRLKLLEIRSGVLIGPRLQKALPCGAVISRWQSHVRPPDRCLRCASCNR